MTAETFPENDDGLPRRGSRVRLLPWTGPEGKPAYLLGDGGPLSAIADEIEEHQVSAAQDLLRLAPCVLDNPKAGSQEVRFTARELAAALTAVVRVAQNREAALAWRRAEQEQDGRPGVRGTGSWG